MSNAHAGIARNYLGSGMMSRMRFRFDSLKAYVYKYQCFQLVGQKWPVKIMYASQGAPKLRKKKLAQRPGVRGNEI